MLRSLRLGLSICRHSVDLSPTSVGHSFLNKLPNALGILHDGIRTMCTLPPHIVITMPSLSPTMSKGSLLNWSITEGTVVQTGQAIAEIETDKATLDFEVVDDGIVAKLLVSPGTKDIEVGQPIAIFVNDKDDVAKFKNYASSASEVLQETVQVAKKELKISPVARKLAKENGIALEKVVSTGRRGIITKDDILAFILAPPTNTKTHELIEAKDQVPVKKQASKETPNKVSEEIKEAQKGPSFVDIPLSQMRRVIAERLVHSKHTIPGIYLTIDCNLTEIEQLRQTFKNSGTKVSVNDFITKAAALSLRDNPSANSYWNDKDGVIKGWTSVDVSFAVATENGLITPIVKNADQKSLETIANEIRELAQKARNNKLKPEEFQGGNFTISNLGMFDVHQFCAIINPPQSSILAVGASHKQLTLKEETGFIENVSKLTVTLTADGRIFDNEISHSFLHSFQHYMEHPLSLLL